MELFKPKIANKTGNKPKEKKPDEYKVILLNDHYTTMDFVVKILMNIFHRSYHDANIIMLEIHHNGKGIVGIFPYDIAVTRAEQVHEAAAAQEFPLKCIVEPV